MLPRVPRQARSLAKYRAILRAALELFRERGYTETTVDALVERSGVSVGVFYSYFASKQQLLLALFEQEADADGLDMFSLPQKTLTVNGIEALLQRFLEQKSALSRARQELQLIDAGFAQQERLLQQRRIERLKLDLQRSREGGRIRSDTPEATCAWILLAIFSRLDALQEEKSTEELAVEVRSAALLIYHMLHSDTPDS